MGRHRLILAARPISAVRDWLRAHDPAYGALRRAARTAVVMPAMFALADKVIANPVVATFAAFGSFAMLLLVDFSGPIKDRLLDQAALVVACAALIALATLVSRTTWLSAVVMAIVAFVVLFAGVISSVLVGATTSLLLAYILPVSLPGTASSIPDRVAGWGLAGGASLFAICLLWPGSERNPVRSQAIAACRALADRLRADVAYMRGGRDSDAEQARLTAAARADEAVEAMQSAFLATPYRPTGLTTDARAVVRLVDELRWLDSIVLRSPPRHRSGHGLPDVGEVKLAAADVLEQAADLLERPQRERALLSAALERMRATLRNLEVATVAGLPVETPITVGIGSSGAGENPRPSRVEPPQAIVSALDPSFRAQELSFVAEQIAQNSDFAALAARRPWLERLRGHQPEGLVGPLASAQERAGSRLAPQSVWLQNSLRGAAALAIAVLVADVTGVQHSFWVAFGTLSVLRSNALSTGQNLVRALAGTTLGFVVGGVLVYLIGTNTTLLWLLLPFVILFAGLAPATISFTAGQAAFTVTLLILFNLIIPAGWKIGLIRIEDVAIGSAVSLAVGLLFWPRGATAALGKALGQAYADSARYLAAAVAYGVGRCDPSGPQPPAPRPEALAAAAASRRLDDAFRGYLAERGAKPASLAAATGLVTGVTGVRLSADAVLDLWERDGARGGERAAARSVLTSASAALTDWYEHFAASMTGIESVPTPLPPDEVADGRLVEAVASDLRDSDGQATATAVRVIWTGDHLDAARRLQDTLVEPARTAASQGRVL